jgi:pimeloyl-ACP methyl ester carboxylesterase
VEIPDPQYVKTEDGAYIAYQVVGEGPVDIAWQFDFWGNIDVWWETALDRYWFESLARMGRLILHDRRATGLSSRNVAAPNLETRAADLRAVLTGSDPRRRCLAERSRALALHRVRR